MKALEVQAKTVEEAVDKALSELDTCREAVDIEVLEEGHRGFFGLMAKDAKVKVVVKETPLIRTEKFLHGLLAHFDIEADFSVRQEKQIIRVEFSGRHVGTLIGRHGTTLDAIQFITSLAVNRGDGQYMRIYMDAQNYRKRREMALEKLAHKMARRAVSTGRRVVLEPMNPNERRIIHTALQNHEEVNTGSIGEGQHRRVVISLKR